MSQAVQAREYRLPGVTDVEAIDRDSKATRMTQDSTETSPGIWGYLERLSAR
ncbi:hypothetical protein J6590_029279 [Homalodisca vitripennis]|nr:hypothetical protein J6590_029279 [Homalodisca vitripennis]